jgi:hypothetical protein
VTVVRLQKKLKEWRSEDKFDLVTTVREANGDLNTANDSEGTEKEVRRRHGRNGKRRVTGLFPTNEFCSLRRLAFDHGDGEISGVAEWIIGVLASAAGPSSPWARSAHP